MTANPPLYGQHGEATYRDPEIPAYAGNPLIESLPSIKSRPELIGELGHFPNFSTADREKPAELRLLMLDELETLYQPLNKGIQIAQTIDGMIRSGYRGRNPLERTFWKDIDQRATDMATPYIARPSITSTASGMSIIGLPGMGKTSIQNRSLLRYNQLQFHREYRSQPFPFQQMVWLKLDIPQDGSLRGFCLQYFAEYDNILGTHYYATYARNGRATIDEMIPRMARVASLHGQGIQMIDELQNLNVAKSGGAEKVLSFLVNFQNIVGIPLVFTGTPASLPILQGKLHMIRRAEGRGCFLWDLMKPDDTDWSLLCDTLWDYQYVQHPVEQTDSMKQALFDACQGITDYAVGMFRDAQRWAIQNGTETLTESLFAEVAEKTRPLSRGLRTAFAAGGTAAAELVGDVNLSGRDAPSPLPPDHTQTQQSASTKKPSPKPKPTSLVPLPEDSLVSIGERGKEAGISAYEALLKADHIRSPREFLDTADNTREKTQ